MWVRKVNRGPLGVLKVHTGKIDNCWKQAKPFLPSNMLTKKGKNKDVMLWLRCWQWRYENKTARLFTVTASTLRAHWAGPIDFVKRFRSNRWTCVFSQVFSCFKRILVQVLDTEFPIYKRFQTLFSIVFCSGFATPLKLACENARAVLDPPGCLCLLYFLCHRN